MKSCSAHFKCCSKFCCVTHTAADYSLIFFNLKVVLFQQRASVYFVDNEAVVAISQPAMKGKHPLSNKYTVHNCRGLSSLHELVSHSV